MMSESEAHRVLIRRMVTALKERFPSIAFVSDLQKLPGDKVPPLINHFRPDAYGEDFSSGKIVIAEAKVEAIPGRVFEKRHTHDQIAAFIRRLEEHSRESCFILAAEGSSADFAKTFLCFIYSELSIKKTAIEVFDSNDFWSLDLAGGDRWHLI